MATAPYQEIRRKLPARASTSDVHDTTKVPLMADLKTLEHFVAALQAFDASQSKTMVQNKRYKTTTIVQSALLVVAISGLIARELGWRSPPAAVESVQPDEITIDWEGVEKRINDRLSKIDPPATTPTDLQLIEAAFIRLAHLQIEQNNYLAEILAGSKRKPPEKSSKLLQAEQIATTPTKP